MENLKSKRKLKEAISIEKTVLSTILDIDTESMDDDEAIYYTPEWIASVEQAIEEHEQGNLKVYENLDDLFLDTIGRVPQ